MSFKKSTDGSWKGKIISFFSRGLYYHCEIIFSDGLSFSAAPGEGTRFKHIDYSDTNIWEIVEVPGINEAKARKFCESEKGKIYDWFGALHFVIPLVSDKSRYWFCSELCYEILREQGLAPRVKSHKIDPTDMYNIAVFMSKK